MVSITVAACIDGSVVEYQIERTGLGRNCERVTKTGVIDQWYDINNNMYDGTN
jgi:hypothetical protein